MMVVCTSILTWQYASRYLYTLTVLNVFQLKDFSFFSLDVCAADYIKMDFLGDPITTLLEEYDIHARDAHYFH